MLFELYYVRLFLKVGKEIVSLGLNLIKIVSFRYIGTIEQAGVLFKEISLNEFEFRYPFTLEAARFSQASLTLKDIGNLVECMCTDEIIKLLIPDMGLGSDHKK